MQLQKRGRSPNHASSHPPEQAPAMRFAFEKDGYSIALAESAADVAAVQALRYAVFVEELGGTGPGVDHIAKRESDRFDAHADHLLLRQTDTGDVVGVYRLMRAEQAACAGGFYSEGEYDLAPLRRSGRTLLELGRSCLRADRRGTAAMMHLWTGLARYVARHGSEVLFGVASLPGTDIATLAPPLSLLHHRHRAPEGLCPRARTYQPMNLMPEHQLDRRAAMIALPALIKGYLRLGGQVGDGAFVDHAFNCTDVCMVMDTAALNDRHARFYQPEAAL